MIVKEKNLIILAKVKYIEYEIIFGFLLSINLKFIKALRMLRVLRPLRMISRNPSLKIAV